MDGVFCLLPAEAAAEAEIQDKAAALIQRLVAAGVMHPRPKQETIPLDPLSAEERKASADRLGRAPGKSASKIVIEGRG